MDNDASIPVEFAYISDFVNDCNGWGTLDELYAFVDGLSATRKEQWRDVCARIRESDHGDSIVSLMNSCPDKRLRLLRCRFLAVVDVLNGVTEEDRVRALLESPPDYGTPNWALLPAGFEYLIAPAERYGQFLSEATQCDLIDTFSQTDFDELQQLADRMRADNAAAILGKWFDERGDDYLTCREMQMIASLISVMGLCGISYE